MLHGVFFSVMLLDKEIDQNVLSKKLLRKDKRLAWVKRIPAITEKAQLVHSCVAAMPGVTDL